jgi:hypothetical protein
VADDELARLFALRPAEFVAARDRLASALKKEGRKDEAATIKALPRPSPSAFAVNQLARRDPKGLARLEAATTALERTQGADSGDEGRRAYREALGEQREALERLVDQARQSLEEAGLATGRDLLDRVASNLRSAMLDEDARALLRQGRLVRDVAAPDLSALLERFPSGGGHGPTHKTRPAPATPAAPERKKAGASKPSAKDAAAALRHEKLEALRERHGAAEAEATRAAQEAETADKAHHDADEALRSARRQLAEREKEAEAATRAAASARHELARRKTILDRLATELARLERG